MKIMDFRSDTVTKPSEEMRRIMACAEVGDDIYGDDPSSNALSQSACLSLGGAPRGEPPCREAVPRMECRSRRLFRDRGTMPLPSQ